MSLLYSNVRDSSKIPRKRFPQQGFSSTGAPSGKRTWNRLNVYKQVGTGFCYHNIRMHTRNRLIIMTFDRWYISLFVVDLSLVKTILWVVGCACDNQ